MEASSETLHHVTCLASLLFTLKAVYLPPIQVKETTWLSIWETEEESRQCQLFQRKWSREERRWSRALA